MATTLNFTGYVTTRTFRDVGSPSDPTAIVNYSVTGVYSTNIFSGDGRSTLKGTAGSDLIFLDQLSYSSARLNGITTILSGSGNDLVDMSSARFKYGSLKIDGGSGNDWLLGNDGNDTIYGGSGADRLKGYGGFDKLYGGSGKDMLFGGKSGDWLTGGLDADVLEGGAGADAFIFVSSSESTMKARDVIVDFTRAQGDRIDVYDIDANVNKAGHQQFKFIGSEGFHNKAGELRSITGNGNTYIYADTNGDGKTDFSVVLDNVSIKLESFDFILS